MVYIIKVKIQKTTLKSFFDSKAYSIKKKLKVYNTIISKKLYKTFFPI